MKTELSQFLKILPRKFRDVKIIHGRQVWYGEYKYKLVLRMVLNASYQYHYSLGRDNSILLYDILKKINTKNIRSRAEYVSYSFFFKTEDDVKKYSKKFTKLKGVRAAKFYVTDESVKKNVILCKNIPFGKFKYKAIFRSKNIEDSVGFLKWIDNLGKDGKIAPYYITEAVRHNFLVGIRTGNYIYITEGEYLSLLQLRIGHLLRCVKEYVVMQNINNEVSNEPPTC